MINPSAIGWIDKFFLKQQETGITIYKDEKDFYDRTRSSGFVYGHIIRFDTPVRLQIKGLTIEEKSKIALLTTLFNLFLLTRQDSSKEVFIREAIAFYGEMTPKGNTLIRRLLPMESPSERLEKIIDQRIRTNDNFISKNFSHIITNALLFIDVLAFYHFLNGKEKSSTYIRKLEEVIVMVVNLALKTKPDRTNYDDLLIKLFESSVRYTKFYFSGQISLNDIDMEYFTMLEKLYITDLAVMTIWSDAMIEPDETHFIKKLGKKLELSPDVLNDSLQSIQLFITKYQNEIPYFRYSNPIKHFYTQTTQNVFTLINRNKRRLQKEILQSKELMVLLTQSTQRELNEKEKRKVRKQVLDICKSIPSLTIFLLPGGSLLLPILIKFIPSLLPSAFNENKDED